jgi:DNA-binding response OmpR family regulator
MAKDGDSASGGGPGPGTLGRAPKTVLIVDDAEDIRLIVSKLLEVNGYVVATAASGAEALRILLEERLPVDLVLLDIMMPELDGFETLRAAREGGISAPVVLLTARSGDADILRGYEAGADYYIAKPFRNETLLNIVTYLIGDLSDDERSKLETQI